MKYGQIEGLETDLAYLRRTYGELLEENTKLKDENFNLRREIERLVDGKRPKKTANRKASSKVPARGSSG